MANRHVALIRGINVGRAKRVAMADLRRMMEELGYVDVRTLLNSGNVVFGAGRAAPARIAARIERGMAERLGVPARVAVLDAATFARVVEQNTLAKRAADPSRLMVTFCADAGDLGGAAPLARKDWSPGALAVGAAAAYVWCPDGILESKLFEAVGRALGASATTRNWATVLKIHAAL